jgi:hypothetical protein
MKLLCGLSLLPLLTAVTVLCLGDCTARRKPHVGESHAENVLEAHLNYSQSADDVVLIKLLIMNRGNAPVVVATRNEAGDVGVLRQVKGNRLIISQVWGTNYGLAGDAGYIPIKRADDSFGGVLLQPGQSAVVDPVAVNVREAVDAGVETVEYNYISNPHKDNPNDLWSGRLTLEFQIDGKIIKK